MDTIDSLSLPQRVVLLGVATLDREAETPAKVNVITRHCQGYAEELADLGGLNEAAVDRALNTLEAEGVVSTPATDDTSPVGKGRPAYEPAVDVEDALAALAEDDRLAGVVEAPETV